MGDDGYGSVNLNFAFPYYDQTFNKAYMYDNGVLSFLQPGTPNALSPWQWSSQPLSQTQAKYFIAPLWADVAPVSQTTYTLTGTATTQKFTWNNIAEFYSRGGILRLNSFSVEINANGDIATKYFGLNLNTSNISIGYKGNTEYNQVAYNSYGYQLSSQADWTANTKVTVTPPPVAPKVYVPEPTPEPVQVVAEPAPQPEVVQQTTPTQTVASTPSSTPTAAVATPAPTQAAASVAVASEPVKTETKKVAAVKVQSTSTETAVVDAAIAVAMQSATQSVNEQVVVSNNFSLSNSNSVVLQRNNNQTTQRQTVEQVDTAQQTNNNTEKKDALEFFVLNSLERQETSQEQKEKALNRGVKSVAELGPEIPLISAYAQIVIPDGAMYIPKEIYKKQRVVDNARLLRSLSNDRRYEEIINQQYTR